MKKIRSFKHFPTERNCIVCGTNEDAECVLLGIDGTSEGNIIEAEPVHLACAIAERIIKGESIILYRKINDLSKNPVR